MQSGRERDHDADDQRHAALGPSFSIEVKPPSDNLTVTFSEAVSGKSPNLWRTDRMVYELQEESTQTTTTRFALTVNKAPGTLQGYSVAAQSCSLEFAGAASFFRFGDYDFTQAKTATINQQLPRLVASRNTHRSSGSTSSTR